MVDEDVSYEFGEFQPLNSTRTSKHLRVTSRSNKVSPTRHDGAVCVQIGASVLGDRAFVLSLGWFWLAISV
jgi:hypothetical protein